MLILSKFKNITFFIVIFGFVLIGETSFVGAQPSVVSTPLANTQGKIDKHIKAYYFHGNLRCYSCKKIEQYSREAIETYFAEQLKNGLLTFQAINIDQPENRHFIQDYQLVTKSLVLIEYQDGKQVKWKNLEKVWQFLNNEEAFLNYVKAETDKYLKGL
jgi:hypothetical protein